MTRTPQPYATIAVIQDNGEPRGSWRICTMGIAHHPRVSCSCGRMGNLGALLMSGTIADIWRQLYTGELSAASLRYMNELAALVLANPEPAPQRMYWWTGKIVTGRSTIPDLVKMGYVEYVPAPPKEERPLDMDMWLRTIRSRDTDMVPYQAPLFQLANWLHRAPQPYETITVIQDNGEPRPLVTEVPPLTVKVAWLHREPQSYVGDCRGFFASGVRLYGEVFNMCMCGHRSFRDRDGRVRYDGYDAGVDPHSLYHDPVATRRASGPPKGLMLQA
jgi:hypothetical protein